jgi:hypothetical protein
MAAEQQGNGRLSDRAENLVENVAFRLAQRRGGRLTPPELLPYLPMSLGMLRECLDAMVDGTSVRPQEVHGLPGYEFAAAREAPAAAGPLQVEACVGCGEEDCLPAEAIVCPECAELLRQELGRLAESTGWPALATYEHEIFYLAAQGENPHRAAELAGRSRLTLKRMRAKLKRLVVQGFLRQELSEEEANLLYFAPPLCYPPALYRRHQDFIRQHPASMAEDVEMRTIRIVLGLAVFLLLLFGLAFAGVPPVLLVLLFLVGAPLLGIYFWTRRERPPET